MFQKTCPNNLELNLEYLDPLQGWCKWAKGKMSESQVSKIDLPPGSRVASVWRVVVDTDDLPFPVKVCRVERLWNSV